MYNYPQQQNYYHPITFYNFQGHPIQMSIPSFNQYDASLKDYYDNLERKQKQLQEENIKLKKQLNEKIKILQQHKKNLQAGWKPKRNYKKRALGLIKHLNCPIKECESRYSSKIALNCHLRKKHKKEEKKQIQLKKNQEN